MAAGATGFLSVTPCGQRGAGPRAAASEGLLTEVGPWVEPRGLEVCTLHATAVVVGALLA